MLGGVCAGIGNRFDLDPTLIRVVALLLAMITLGTTLIIYLVLWIIVPGAPAAGADDTPHRSSRGELTEEFRDAGGRLTQAGRIVGRAAKQAASELNDLQRRPVAPPPVGDEARGAQAVNEDVLKSDGPRNAGNAGSAGNAGNAGNEPLPRGGTPEGSDTMPTPPTPPRQPRTFDEQRPEQQG